MKSYGRVQRSSGRHSSTRDHLVSEGLLELGGGERVVATRVGSREWVDCKRLS